MTGLDQRGGGGGQEHPPPPPTFGGLLNFMNRERMSRACARKRHISVLNSYPDPPPPFPKSCLRPCFELTKLSGMNVCLTKAKENSLVRGWDPEAKPGDEDK